jgi:hypothetical protein
MLRRIEARISSMDGSGTLAGWDIGTFLPRPASLPAMSVHANPAIGPRQLELQCQFNVSWLEEQRRETGNIAS